MIFINDHPDACKDYAEILLFADDAKLFKHVRTNADSTMLQTGCDRLFQWSSKWQWNNKKFVVLFVFCLHAH